MPSGRVDLLETRPGPLQRVVYPHLSPDTTTPVHAPGSSVGRPFPVKTSCVVSWAPSAHVTGGLSTYRESRRGDKSVSKGGSPSGSCEKWISWYRHGFLPVTDPGRNPQGDREPEKPMRLHTHIPPCPFTLPTNSLLSLCTPEPLQRGHPTKVTTESVGRYGYFDYCH